MRTRECEPEFRVTARLREALDSPWSVALRLGWIGLTSRHRGSTGRFLDRAAGSLSARRNSRGRTACAECASRSRLTPRDTQSSKRPSSSRRTRKPLGTEPRPIHADGHTDHDGVPARHRVPVGVSGPGLAPRFGRGRPQRTRVASRDALSLSRWRTFGHHV